MPTTGETPSSTEDGRMGSSSLLTLIAVRLSILSSWEIEPVGDLRNLEEWRKGVGAGAYVPMLSSGRTVVMSPFALKMLLLWHLRARVFRPEPGWLGVRRQDRSPEPDESTTSQTWV